MTENVKLSKKPIVNQRGRAKSIKFVSFHFTLRMKISVENKRKKNIDMNFAPLPKDFLC